MTASPPSLFHSQRMKPGTTNRTRMHQKKKKIQQNTSYPSLNKINNKLFYLLGVYIYIYIYIQILAVVFCLIKFEYRSIYTKKEHLSETSLTITESKCCVPLDKGYAGLITINHLYASVCCLDSHSPVPHTVYRHESG